MEKEYSKDDKFKELQILAEREGFYGDIASILQIEINSIKDLNEVWAIAKSHFKLSEDYKAVNIFVGKFVLLDFILRFDCGKDDTRELIKDLGEVDTCCRTCFGTVSITSENFLLFMQDKIGLKRDNLTLNKYSVK